MYPRSYEDAGKLLRRLDHNHAARARKRFRDVPCGPAPDQHDQEWTRRWEQDFDRSARDYYRFLGEDA